MIKPEAKSPEVNAWEENNSMIIAWLLNSLEKDLQGSVAYADDAKTTWDDLKEHFSQENASRVHQLKRDISLFRQERQPIAVYHTKLKMMWDELSTYTKIPTYSCAGCTCGSAKEIAQQREEEKVHQFLMGLNRDTYEIIQSQILSMEPLPSINKVYAIVMREEKQRATHKGAEVNIEAAAINVGMLEGNEQIFDVKASTRNSGTSKLRCDRYERTGHDKSKCYELIGYPPNWKPRRSNKNKGFVKASHVSEATVERKEPRRSAPVSLTSDSTHN
ncbi:uncharacterized protein [Elaeis guineensis]|uniref:uncharacterized protein n=1 Tax=Elaeis guineensis var. tenera TaxID=51953 RepID=UPI003C6D13F6